MGYQMTGTERMKSGKRVAAAMWEYSWLLQRDGRQAEFADWDKVLDEVVERGYDCLRIDAFPHQIARGKDGQLIEEFDHVPDNNYMWTRYEPVHYNPRKGLVEFMRKCRDRGIYVGLSSWYRHDTTHREMEQETAEDYARIWIETLDYLAENDLLDAICWVDLCNEVLSKAWMPGFKEKLFSSPYMPDADDATLASMPFPLEPQSYTNFADFMNRAITPIREKYPQLLYTFSVYYGEQWKKMDWSCCDLIDLHIWSVFDMSWMVASGFYDMSKAFVAGNTNLLDNHLASKIVEHIEKSREYYMFFKPQIEEFLKKQLKEWSETAQKSDCLLITTEAWASVVYEDIFLKGALGEWDWCFEVDEFGVKTAIENGWTGICTSNFCEPQFEGMWHDIQWHKKMTDMIKG